MSASSKVKLSPHRLDVTRSKQGFAMKFSGRANGRTVEVVIECPKWWRDHVLYKLA